MSVKKKLKQNLDKVSIYKIDTTENSIVFNISDLPNKFTAGKNSFKIAGSLLLRQDSEVLIEILDANDQPIYYQVNNFTDRLKNKIVSVYIYPETAIGQATITILGELYTDDIPIVWRGISNVKWTKKINIDSLQQNNSEIIFDDQPIITINEQFKPAASLSYQSGSIVTLTSSSFENSTIKYYNSVGQTWASNYSEQKELFSDSKNTNAKSNQSIQQNYNTNLLKETKFNSKTDFRVEASEDYFYLDKSGPTIVLDTLVSGSGFTSEMIGGEISVVLPLNTIPSTSYNNSYVGIISDVLNKTTLRLSNPFYVSASNKGYDDIMFINNFGPNEDYQIKYTESPAYSGSQAYKTFAAIQLHNLIPVSGDVYRIKTFAKSKSSLSDYELIGNNIVNKSNMLIDSSSANSNLEIGKITSQSIINSFWSISNLLGSAGDVLTHDCSEINNAFKIVFGAVNDGKLEVYPSSSQTYYTNNDYEIKLTCCGKKITTAPILKVYMSGSAFTESDVDEFGKLIGTVTLNTESKKTFQDLTFTFSPQNNATAKPIFLIESGEWHISDVEIFPQSLPGFTPNYLLLNAPVNSTWDNNTFDFKFEFFDYTEKMSNQIIYVENVPFSKGSPSYIQGNYNLLTGSQYMGDKIGEGLVLSGEKGATFSSVGYKGFISASTELGPSGFMIWSGSALSNEADNYSGIGAEFVANSSSYFRYRTDPSELIIRTDNFYFGSNEQYISGSNGHLEISSSNFYLDNNGNITATAATLRKYVFTDYIANNILILTPNNIDNYLIPYLHPTIGKNFNYLDLSGDGKASAMFVRFEVSSSYPISHILAPTVTGFLDDEVGGNIVVEFANVEAGDGVYFYDIRKNVGEENIEFANAYNLSGSNSIYNLSGSFSYLGFKANHTGSEGTEYIGSLQAKKYARYSFSKGNTGWALTGTSNFDRTGINLLEVNVPYLKGVRSNQFIKSSELYFSNATGSYLRSFDTNFNMPSTDLALSVVSGSYQYGSIYGSFLFPDYIKSSTCRLIIYYRIMPTLFNPGEHTVSCDIYSSITSSSLSDNFLMSASPAINYVSIGSTSDSSVTTLATGEEIVPWKVDITSSRINSGQVMGFKINITSLKRITSNIPGKIRIFGIRIITDRSSNLGGFDADDMTKGGNEGDTPI
jgi:hypothetical protein